MIGELPNLRGDHNLLRQVWANLLENAIKYSRNRESPRVEIRSWTEGEEIRFAVSDNGVGFDMCFVGKLFGVFQRLHRQEEFEGTGIGLAIAHRIVTRHGGRIWAAQDRGPIPIAADQVGGDAILEDEVAIEIGKHHARCQNLSRWRCEGLAEGAQPFGEVGMERGGRLDLDGVDGASIAMQEIHFHAVGIPVEVQVGSPSPVQAVFDEVGHDHVLEQIAAQQARAIAVRDRECPEDGRRGRCL
ncbi:MAG: hypothetical protein IPN71_07500 [Fibrobacteres bacterium]|nr:hypothetical protein [Fibrobacterota bacterium]